nr:hypothetical protein [Bacteroidales bacterium]
MKTRALIFSVMFSLAVNSLTAKEVLSLDLNRVFFIPGDTIRFKAILIDSDTENTKIVSNYIYAELLKDSVITRVKIKRDEDGFSGYFPLRGDLPY